MNEKNDNTQELTKTKRKNGTTYQEASTNHKKMNNNYVISNY